jgi:hypothetical protein
MQNFNECFASMDEWVVVPTRDSRGDHQTEEASGTSRHQLFTLMADRQSGKIVFLSTRNSRDSDRWSLMPTVEPFKESLVALDLHKSRYIQTLHESVGDLKCLKYLMITRCTSLRTLPDSLGSLSNLEEVGFYSIACITVSHRIPNPVFGSTVASVESIRLVPAIRASRVDRGASKP